VLLYAEGECLLGVDEIATEGRTLFTGLGFLLLRKRVLSSGLALKVAPVLEQTVTQQH
jgi:hypothetical protein